MQIYKITNTITGQCYIGKTYKNFQYRYGRDWATSKGLNEYLKHSVQKYGKEAFIVEIVFEQKQLDHEKLSNLEKEFIAQYDCISPKGFNFTTGGDGGHKFSECRRKKLSDKQKGKKPAHLHTPEMTRKRVEASKKACIGIKRSEETRKKLSLAHKGVPCKHNWSPVILKNRETGIEIGFRSCKDACEYLDSRHGGIFNVLSGLSKTVKGYYAYKLSEVEQEQFDKIYKTRKMKGNN